jgi:hypothetical protein
MQVCRSPATGSGTHAESLPCGRAAGCACRPSAVLRAARANPAMNGQNSECVELSTAPFVGLRCWVRSLTSRPRSRPRRRLSPCSGLGTRTTRQTGGSPRSRTISMRSRTAVSIRSVSARRDRWPTRMLEVSRTGLLIPESYRRRRGQTPS